MSTPFALGTSRAFCAFALMLGLPGVAAAGEADFWITRHGEDMIGLVDLGGGLFQEDCNQAGCCIEPLDPAGELRADLLTYFLAKANVLPDLTDVIASHKSRTQQIVRPTADVVSLPVVSYPVGVQECDPGFESANTSRAPMVAAIRSAPDGSTMLVAAHSGTIYNILGDLGIDTSDPYDFPRAPDGKVRGFNNLWHVHRNADDTYQLDGHVLVDFTLVGSVGRSTTAP